MSDVAMYNEIADPNTKEDLIIKHIDLVKRIAYHMKSRLPDSVQVSDMLQAGMVGLIEAGRTYSSDKGASFKTFAGTRIRGAIIDDMRKNNWLPRSVTQKARKVSQAIQQIEQSTLQQATPEMIAKYMGISLEDYHRMIKDVGSTELFSLDEQVYEVADSHNFMSDIVNEDLKQHLADVITSLPEKEQLVLNLYYYEELNFKEVAEVLDVSESRVSQLHGQAISRIKAKMNKG